MKYIFHSHTLFSDGKLKAEDLLLKAYNKGFTIFGFSDHSPVPFDSYWNMKYEKLYPYLKEINRLKFKHKDKEIYLGMEADFLEGKKNIGFLRQFGFDYIIGGVHYFTEELDGVPFNLDESLELFTMGLNRVFGCNVEEMVLTYYDLVLKMIENDKPDIIAHLNLIEKFNFGDRFFRTDTNWYKDKIIEVLNAVKSKNIILELNSRSKYKGYIENFMPSLWMVKEAKKLNIPFIISGDVHSEEDLDKFWDDSINALKDAGYNEILVLKGKNWLPVKI